MKNLMLIFFMPLFMYSCGSSNPEVVVGGPAPVSSPCPSPSPSLDPIQTVVNNYNQYQVSIGNDPIQPGLKCTLYSVPNMPSNACLSSSNILGCSQISNSTGFTSVGSFTYVGQINQTNELGTSGFNMLPPNLQTLYPTNFELICNGYFVNPDDNYHEFDVASDDGSLLYIGGSLVVSNDGLHSILDKSGQKYLQSQVYSFQLDYFQGPGYVALTVNEDGQPVSAESFWH